MPCRVIWMPTMRVADRLLGMYFKITQTTTADSLDDILRPNTQKVLRSI